jgi:hypothetical protein
MRDHGACNGVFPMRNREVPCSEIGRKRTSR